MLRQRHRFFDQHRWHPWQTRMLAAFDVPQGASFRFLPPTCGIFWLLSRKRLLLSIPPAPASIPALFQEERAEAMRFRCRRSPRVAMVLICGCTLVSLYLFQHKAWHDYAAEPRSVPEQFVARYEPLRRWCPPRG